MGRRHACRCQVGHGTEGQLVGTFSSNTAARASNFLNFLRKSAALLQTKAANKKSRPPQEGGVEQISNPGTEQMKALCCWVGN